MRRSDVRRRRWARAALIGSVLAPMAVVGCAAVGPGPGAGPSTDKVLVCHKGKTLEVGGPAADAHIKHGDSLGRCR